MDRCSAQRLLHKHGRDEMPLGERKENQWQKRNCTVCPARGLPITGALISTGNQNKKGTPTMENQNRASILQMARGAIQERVD